MSKLKKGIKYLAFTFLALVLFDAGFVVFFPKNRLPSSDEPVDAIVVLGAAPNSPAIRERAWHGYVQYRDGLGTLLIFSGGRTSPLDETEAQNMSRFLAKKGVLAPQALEENSSNTWENLSFTRQELPMNFNIMVVTDTYHIPRAVLVSTAVGFEEVYWSAPSSNYYKFSELCWYYFREMVALPNYLPRILMKKL